MAEVNIEGIPVQFPFEPYKCQLAYMERVIQCLNQGTNAALESPTGTGKTLSLLCSTLAWLQARKEKLRPDWTQQGGVVTSDMIDRLSLPRILYASRTHSQLAQVVREVNKTNYKYLKIAVMGSRDQLCINETVCKEPNNVIKANMCRSLVSARKCRYYNEYDKNAFLTTDQRYTEEGKVLDIEDIVSVGRKIGECPFYRSRSMFDTADLILLPYNYILDPRVRRANKIELKGSIVIFDEAHNLEQICEESASVSIKTSDISACLREAKQTLELIISEEEQLRKAMDESTVAFGQASTKEEKQKSTQVEKKDLAHLIVLLQNLEKNVDDIDLTRDGKQVGNLSGKVFPGEFVMTLLERSEFRRDMRDAISSLIDKVGVYLANHSQSSQGIWQNRGSKLQEFSSFISTVYADSYEDMALLNRCDTTAPTSKEQAKRFNLYMASENAEGKNKTSGATGLTLNYWCFSAGLTMRFLQSRGVRSIIVTSGTLSPLTTFVAEMGINFPVTLENEHAASSSQVIAAAVRNGVGPSVGGVSKPVLLNGAFQNRQTAGYVSALGELLVQTARIVPQGVLVFFASYSQLNFCVQKWKEVTQGALSNAWARLNALKAVFIEPHSKVEFHQTVINFTDAVENGKGGMMLAVCRGKMSEGIDFADSHCRAVVIIGIPYPPLMDARVCLKKNYLNELRCAKQTATDPEVWYATEGVRAVNQAMGRVIRHKDDFGVVILADSRFCGYDERRFPAWLRRSMRSFDVFDAFLKEMAEFFRRRGLKPGDPAPSMTKVRSEVSVAQPRRPYDLFNPIKGESSSQKPPTTSLDVDLANVYGCETKPGNAAATTTIGPVRAIGSALAELVSLTCASFVARPIIGSRRLGVRSIRQRADATQNANERFGMGAAVFFVSLQERKGENGVRTSIGVVGQGTLSAQPLMSAKRPIDDEPTARKRIKLKVGGGERIIVGWTLRHLVYESIALAQRPLPRVSSAHRRRRSPSTRRPSARVRRLVPPPFALVSPLPLARH
uniref:DNA helicase n=2 Tax=Plectus sambesii TaxID=2011161 RepID=A0A914XD34_9BILA